MARPCDTSGERPSAGGRWRPDVIALALVLTAVVALVIIGTASATVLAAAGAFVIGIMTVWFRRA